MIALIILSVFVPQILCESVVLLDLTPEEAQKLIAGRSLAVNYARQIDERPLSAADEENRNFYHQGKLIENPNDFVQRTFEANQFHAQDGLGRSIFGYSDWNQGRLEARNANGEVRGSYQYVDPFGEDVIVNYWSDSLGFHQMDNRKKFFVPPVTETPEVQAARAAHEKAWAAAAKAARVVPDPMSDIYNANSNKLDEEQSEADQKMEIISGVANQQQSLTRYPNLPYTNHIQPDEEGSFSHDSVVVESVGEARDNKKIAKIQNDEEDEEEPSNPRGFFYSFDYPVQLILENSDERQQRSVSAKNNEKTSKSQLDSSLEAEIAEYKIVKRSENRGDASKVIDELNKSIDAEGVEKPNPNVPVEVKNVKENTPATIPEFTEPLKEEIDKTDVETAVKSIKPESKTIEAQIPVIVKVESESQPSEFLLKSEVELRQLATDEDVIDAVHDTQVHRHANA